MELSEQLALDCGHAVRPALGHHAGGDAAVVVAGEDCVFVAVVDVLGHGLEANGLAIEVEMFLREHACSDVADLMTRLDARLAGSRGAGAGLCSIERESGRASYCGVGNTVLRRFGSAGDARLVSRDGVLGSARGRIREQALGLERGDVLLMYSDGVRSHFTLSEYPQLLSDRATTIAATVVERFGKEHDDASCIAVRRG